MEGKTIRKSLLIRNDWPLLLLASVVLVISTPYHSLFFLNDDFTSIPVYGQRHFTYGRNTRIIPAISLYMDYLLYGRQAYGYILTNMLLHVGCCFAGYAWCRQMATSFTVVLPRWVLLAGTLLFMWFGLHSEVLLWPICRTASISLLCFFGAWICCLRFSRSYIWVVPAFAFILAGLLSYEVLLLLPFQMVVWYFFTKKNTSGLVFAIALLTSVAGIASYYAIKYFVTHHVADDYGAEHFTALNVPVLLKNYCSLVIRTFSPPLENKQLVAGAGLAAGLLLGWIVYLMCKHKNADAWWKFLLLNWLGSYVLFCSLGIDLSGNESDRYLYVPSFFFCAWFAYSLYLLPLNRIYRVLIISLVLFYHISCFYSSVSNFQKAGSTAKMTLSRIYEHYNAAGLEVESLPAKAYGIPILRSGVKNGLKWFYPDMDTAKVFIRSQVVLPIGNIPVADSGYKMYFDTAKNVNVLHLFPGEKSPIPLP